MKTFYNPEDNHLEKAKSITETKIVNWHSALADDDEADDLLSGSGSDDLDADWHSPLAEDDEADDFNSSETKP